MTVVLSVLDASEQQAETAPRGIVLPGRRFFDPLAAAIIEQRRDLLWSKGNATRIGQILRAVRDADFLVDEFDRVDCGVDTGIEIECPECFATQEVDLPFDRTFFMPGKERAARRRGRTSSFQG